MPSRVVHSQTMWEMFWEADTAAKKVWGSIPVVYRVYLAAEGTGFGGLPFRSHTSMVSGSFDEAMAIPDAVARCVSIAADYGEKDAFGRPDYRLYAGGLTVLRSLVQFAFSQVSLDGDLLCMDPGDVARELLAYRLVKELMAGLDAEECWGMIDDGKEGEAGYGPYYGAEMVPFHFRKQGPQTMIAGLEDGIRPTCEMYEQARNAEPFLHGYRRTLLRIVDLPWEDYWQRVHEGEAMPSRLITSGDDERICSGQTARHLETDRVENFWIEKGGYPVDGSVRSIP